MNELTHGLQQQNQGSVKQRLQLTNLRQSIMVKNVRFVVVRIENIFRIAEPESCGCFRGVVAPGQSLLSISRLICSLMAILVLATRSLVHYIELYFPMFLFTYTFSGEVVYAAKTCRGV